MNRKSWLLAFAAPLALAAPITVWAQEQRLPRAQPEVLVPADAEALPLETQFRDPPNSARPRVWWHWMNGNITKDGIAKDFAWMKRVGIGGMQNFDANLMTPKIVDKRLVYMTPEWKDAFRFAATEADRLGLELTIASSPGWSETGGPWVKPEDGLKKLVWSETTVAGGKPFTGKLAAPPSNTGPFQSLKPAAGLWRSDGQRQAQGAAAALWRGQGARLSGKRRHRTWRRLRRGMRSADKALDPAGLSDGDLDSGRRYRARRQGPQSGAGARLWQAGDRAQPVAVRTGRGDDVRRRALFAPARGER